MDHVKYSDSKLLKEIFQKGYQLGNNDAKSGVYIELEQITSTFFNAFIQSNELTELTELTELK